jgi:hypothetical protein
MSGTWYFALSFGAALSLKNIQTFRAAEQIPRVLSRLRSRGLLGMAAGKGGGCAKPTLKQIAGASDKRSGESLVQ